MLLTKTCWPMLLTNYNHPRCLGLRMMKNRCCHSPSLELTCPLQQRLDTLPQADLSSATKTWHPPSSWPVLCNKDLTPSLKLTCPLQQRLDTLPQADLSSATKTWHPPSSWPVLCNKDLTPSLKLTCPLQQRLEIHPPLSWPVLCNKDCSHQPFLKLDCTLKQLAINTVCCLAWQNALYKRMMNSCDYRPEQMKEEFTSGWWTAVITDQNKWQKNLQVDDEQLWLQTRTNDRRIYKWSGWWTAVITDQNKWKTNLQVDDEQLWLQTRTNERRIYKVDDKQLWLQTRTNGVEKKKRRLSKGW